MQLSTLLRLGTLAVTVVKDEKVQELVKMAHKGAKRRGLFSPPPDVPQYPVYHPQRRRPPW